MVNLKSYAVRGHSEINEYGKIVLFGAGSYVMDSINTFGKEKIIAILDNDAKKWGKKIQGIKIENPKKFFEEVKDNRFAIVLSTSGFQYEIAEELVHTYKCSKEQLFSLCPDYQEERMYQVRDILNKIHDIQTVYEMLEDEPSKEYFENSLIARITHNPLFLKPNASMKNVCWYSGKQDIRPFPGTYVLDCGAYIGDTARMFWDMMNQKGKIYCFEPFEGNFKQLSQWVKETGLKDKVIPYQIAVSNQDSSMVISAGTSVSMRANLMENETEKNKVSVKKIDSMQGIEIEKADFIKMDIEGEELNALEGAKAVIEAYKPQMMISAYHKTSHLWEIPLKLKEIVPEYKIYLGHSPNVSFEPEIYVTI